ncbi:MAG: peptide deformylase [Bacteroidetes bacterium]|uniref:Peptide deformylase n=1 Tax=Candidatus Cryptobacteroides intestinigallinarum TaxID=2840767 RepID=A0A9D9N144_9BACT|nr:peptide deformylase [Candidatus Cryptobacteroides intestinigallinarum]
MVLPIYLYGSEILREDASEADLSDKEYLSGLVSDMKETLKSADGCGLAAPQVGVGLRVLIVDGDVVADVYDYLKGFRRTMINPVLVAASDETREYQEGCLSVPGIYADVRRPAKITVEYYDENFQKQTEEFDRFACRMIQHEMDHLDGNLFVDRVAPIRKKIIGRKLQGIAQGKVHPRYRTKQ